MGKAISRTATAIVGLVAATIAFGAATPATAETVTDAGFWYYDIYGVQAAHDAGLTGKGLTIAVFDSQINLDVPTLKGADIEVQEPACYEEDGTLIPAESSDITAVHGTNIVSYLVGSGAGYPGQKGVKGIVPDAKIIYTTIGRALGDGTSVCFGEEPGEDSLALANGFRSAVDEGADLVSASLLSTPDAPQIVELAGALHAGIPIIAAVSNDLLNEDYALYPSTGNGVVGVQSMNTKLGLQGDTAESHFDDRIYADTDVVGAGVGIIWQGDGNWETQKYAQGTSLATPIVAGLLGLVAEKYPDATGNQLVQTLIRNTGKEDHPLEYDTEQRYGYGVASLQHMLSVDPTQYEDVNPLINDEQKPSAEMIADPPTLAEYDPTYAEGDWKDDGPPKVPALDTLILPIVLGLGGLVVGAGIIALIVVLVVRRKKKA